MTRTDWDSYYTKPCKLAKYSRAYTLRKLSSVIARLARRREGLSMAELGGAGSCFMEQLIGAFRPAHYHVYDTNAYGLSLLEPARQRNPCIALHNKDVTAFVPERLYDVVFSIGLIEHFDEATTRRVIEAHFAMAEPGGLVVLSYPTPTALYTLARTLAEKAGAWIFTDERPLRFAEVRPTVERLGRVESVEVLWPLVFTQQMVAVVKHPAAGQPA